MSLSGLTREEQLEDDEALHHCGDPLCLITPRAQARDDPVGTVKSLLRMTKPWKSVKLRAVGQIVRPQGPDLADRQLVSADDPSESTMYLDDLIEAGLLRVYTRALAKAPSPKLKTAGAVFEGVANLIGASLAPLHLPDTS